MLIRSINESDNESLSRILREVLVEMEIPKKGSAYEDPELDKMFEASIDRSLINSEAV